MAFASVGSFIAANNHTGTQLWQPTIGTATAAGDVLILAIAQDNRSAAADGDNGEVFSVGDSKNNTWRKLAEFGNTNASAAAGAAIGLWTTDRAYSALTTSDTLQIQFGKGSNVTAKACSGWRFTIAAGQVLAEGGPDQISAQDAATTYASITFGGLPSQEWLWVRANAEESNNVTQWTTTVGFTSFTNSTDTVSGTSSSDMGVRAEFIIATGTTQTSAPTNTITAADMANAMIAVGESAAAAAMDRFPLPLADPFLDNRQRM